MALLAGLARAPSRFSPLTNVEAARARRDQVLGTMIAAGYLTEDEANHWRARPVVVRQRPDFFRTTSPYFAEHVRRDVVRRYGEKKLLEGGLDIETAVVPWIDASAQENVDFSLRKLDKRQGWRGPVARLAGAGGRRVPRPHRRALRRRSARRGAAVPGHRRGRGGGGRVPRARRQGDLHAAARRDDVGGAVQRQGRRQRQAAGVDRRRAARGRRRLGAERAPVEAAAVRRLDLRRQERGAVAARLRRDRARQGTAEAPRAGQARRAAAGADAARAGHALQLRPRHRLRRRDGGRRRLRSLGVQPRVAGLPPARVRRTSRCTTRSRSTAATASRRC